MTVPTHTEIAVAGWTELATLPPLLDDVGTQLADTLAFARTHVADPAGFAPSPVCLLRPLGAAMEALDDALGAVAARLADDGERLRDDVVVALGLLRAADDASARRTGALRSAA